MKGSKSPVAIASERTGTTNAWLRSVVLALLAVVGVAVSLRAANLAIALATHKGLGSGFSLPSLPLAPEAVDKTVWAGSLLCAGVLLILALFARGRAFLARPIGSILPLLIGVTGLFLGVSWVEPFGGITVYWFGFGTQVLLFVIALIPALYLLLQHPDQRLIRFMGLASMALVLVVYLPSVIQPMWGVIDPVHSSYIFNELLAPTQGHFALGQQVPQYTSLFGLPLVPIWRAFPAVNTVYGTGMIVTAYLTALALLTVAGSTFLAFRVLPERIRSLALLLTVPLILVKVQPPTTGPGSIAALFSAIPIRTLPMVAVALLLTYFAQRGSLRRSALTGLACGLAALNNFEFGVPCAIAALLTLWIGSLSSRTAARVLGSFVGGALTPTVLYMIFLYAVDQPMQWSYWAAFALSFGSGFGAVPMPLVGPHILILAILISGVVVGAYHLGVTPRMLVGAVDVTRRRAAFVSLFFGLAGLGSFGYYVGRSVVSGQLQIFLLYIAPIISAELALVAIPRLGAKPRWSVVAATAMILLPAALAIASVLQAPDARQEWSRVALTNKSAPEIPMKTESANLARLAADAKAALGGVNLVAAVGNGNYMEALTGLENFSAIDRPAEAWALSSGVRDAVSKRLSEATGPVLVEGFVNPNGELLCPGFSVILKMSDTYSVIQRKTH